MADAFEDPHPRRNGPITIDVALQSQHTGINPESIREAVHAALTRHGCRSASVCVALVDDDEMAHLHEEHLNIRGPTDVLTFDLSIEANSIDGEIVVGMGTANREARRRGHPIQAEVVLYALHGALHLLGYDDLTPIDSQIMHDQEDLILESLGWGRVFAADRRPARSKRRPRR